jgi:putative protein-disulfide isomerase
VTLEFRVLFVTDPLCSWCWGTAQAMESARRDLARRVEFDLVFGGVNVDSFSPVGRYGRQRLSRLWQEVAAVTGQPFAPAPPAEPFVYNSAYLCALLEAVREHSGRPPFAFLHALQEAFFARAQNVTEATVFTAILEHLGEEAHAVVALAATEAVRARAQAGFAEARSRGTHAMPSLVIEAAGVRRLLAGGYLDAATLVTTVEAALRRSSPPPA